MTQTIGGVLYLCPTAGTKSLKFSSGLIVNTDAFSTVIGCIRMFERWSLMPVSALFPFNALLFSYHSLGVSFAVYCNDLECLEWVLEQGVTWAKIVYREDYFQWLGLEEMDLTEAFVDVCLHAARLGRLEILQYAVEDGCPWDPAICLKVAEKKKHDHVVKWITNYAREASSSESYES